MNTTIYFATNRQITSEGEFSDWCHPNMDELRFGSVTFNGSELYSKELEEFMNLGQVEVLPEDVAAGQFGSIDLFTRLQNIIRNKKKDVLIYIHGYNYSFRESAARAAQMQQLFAAAGKDILVVLFAWPSRGEGIAPRTYSDDRTQAQVSGLALGRALLKVTDFIRATRRADACFGSIHLMAHSMGNWALRWAIQSMRTFVGDTIPPLFDEVLLVAADEDDDTLSEPKMLTPLLRGARRITVYFNHQDLAL